MLVWRDTSDTGTTKKRRPSWLDDEADFSSMPCTEGYLWTPTHYASVLSFRADANWTDIGDGWSCALYEPLAPQYYLRNLKCTLWIDLEDVDGTFWQIPALLRPDGLPAIGMKNKQVITADGFKWERLAPSPRLVRALECALEMRPHCEDDFENMEDPDQLATCMMAILESAYYFNAPTIGCMALLGDTLLYKGCQVACAVLSLEHGED